MNGVSLIETDTLNALIGKINALEGRISAMFTAHTAGTSKWMTVQEVAEHLKKSKQWVNNYKQHIGCSKSTGTLLFKRSDVEAFVESGYYKKAIRRK